MVKDPFDPKFTPSKEDAYAFEEDTSIDDAADLKTGSASRTITKSLTRYLVPVVFLGIIVWIFMPTEDPNAKRVKATTEYNVDDSKQANNTNALLDAMKEDAGATPQKNPAVGLPFEGAAPSTNVQTRAKSKAEIDAELAQVRLSEEAEAARLKRIEDVRMSPLEVGALKLASENQSQTGLGGSGTRLDALQSELAATNAMREDAIKRGEAMQNKALAALSPQREAPKKSNNSEFLSEQASISGDVNQVVRQQPAAGTTVINQGHIIRTVLLSGINSDLPGVVTAAVTADVWDSRQKSILIPKGSKIVGSYSSQVVVGQDRVLVATNRLILPDGTWVSLQGSPASAMTGESGMSADVNNHFMKMFGTSLVLGASSLLLSNEKSTVTSNSNGGGFSSSGNPIAIALNDSLKAMLERNKNIAPTLTVKPGTEFILFAAKDIVMQPWRKD